MVYLGKGSRIRPFGVALSDISKQIAQLNVDIHYEKSPTRLADLIQRRAILVQQREADKQCE